RWCERPSSLYFAAPRRLVVISAEPLGDVRTTASLHRADALRRRDVALRLLPSLERVRRGVESLVQQRDDDLGLRGAQILGDSLDRVADVGRNLDVHERAGALVTTSKIREA